MTTLHPTTDTEIAAAVPLTRREARARERAMFAGDEGRTSVVEAGVAAEEVAPVDLAGRGSAVGGVPAVEWPVAVTLILADPVDELVALPSRHVLRRTERADRRRATRGSRRAAESAGRPRVSATARAAAPRATAAQRTTRIGVVGAMLFVGATVVSTSVPANAYFVDTPEHVAVKLAVAAESGTTVGGAVATTRGQKFVASGAVSDEDVDRDGYSVTSLTQKYQNTSAGTFTNDASAAVQWPFAVGVPISSGFGSRQVANCSFCSTFHQGLDFTPGAGSPIQIIADGTVSKVDQGSGALGYNVWIEHTIGGVKVTSVYAHMLAGSIKVVEGQKVTVGQIVGLVGSTGNSTGAHLHFEIHLAGVPVDPYPWLEANAGA